jgi:hypothetical protein
MIHCKLGRTTARSLVKLSVPLLAVVLFTSADFKETPPSTELYRKDLAQQNAALKSLWTQKLKWQEQLARRGKSGTINSKLPEEVSVMENGAIRFKSKEAKAKWLATATEKAGNLKQQLADTRNGLPSVPPVLLAPVQAGQVGTLSNGGTFPRAPWVKVVQVVDDQTAIVNLRLDRRADPSYFDAQDVWLYGISTEGMLDGKYFDLELDTVWCVVGRKQYETAIGGSNTIVAIRALSEAEWKQFVAQVKQ